MWTRVRAQVHADPPKPGEKPAWASRGCPDSFEVWELPTKPRGRACCCCLLALFASVKGRERLAGVVPDGPSARAEAGWTWRRRNPTEEWSKVGDERRLALIDL